MKKAEGCVKTFIKRIKNDFEFRTYLFSFLSFFVTVLFAGYNIFLGVVYRSVWNACIAAYYALLLLVRVRVIYSEWKLNKTHSDEQKKGEKRKKLYFEHSVMLFAIDFALIAPISIMVCGNRPIAYSSIPAITIATYTTYKTTIAIINFVKTRKADNLSIKLLKNINFIDALVSVLSLQYTLIMTFGEAFEGDIFVLCSVSSLFVWLFLAGFALYALIRSVALIRRNE